MCAACEFDERVGAIKLTAREQTHLVKLVTDRPEQTLRVDDQGIEKRVMNSLVVKGMALAITDGRGRVEGWSLTPQGQQRSQLIY